jgi:hypothetical protein
VLLPKPSTPAQWKTSFRTSTDDELRSLLVQQHDITGNRSSSNSERDLSPLGAELRRTASRIKEYRALEKAIFDAHARGSTTHHHPKKYESTSSASANVVCFYKAHPANPNDDDDHDAEADANAELIELCLRILEISSSRGKDVYKRTISVSIISSVNGRTHTRGESETTTMDAKQPPMIPTLSELRQKLVPSKLKEHVFWESLWVVLYERKKIRSKQAVMERIEYSANETSALLTEKKYQSRLGSNSAIAPNERKRIALLERQLNASWECISDLTVRNQAEAREREAMEELVEKLWLMIQMQKQKQKNDPNANNPSNQQHYSMDLPPATKTINTSTGDATNNNNNLPCVQYGNGDNESAESSEEAEHETIAAAEEKQQQHIGQWEMSKDSLEFLAFPSEAKGALRTEKQKRLARVNEEMAFILDSDDPKDSRGEWSCCHKANYNDVCGSPR